MFSIFTHFMKPVRYTNSKPGLPVVSVGVRPPCRCPVIETDVLVTKRPQLRLLLGVLDFFFRAAYVID